jgi:hypothetical protein
MVLSPIVINLIGEYKMTKKSNAVKFSAQEVLAIATAEAIVSVGNAQAVIDANCVAIRKARKGKPLGTVAKGDAVMIRFTDTLAQAGKSEQTIKNYATAFRKAVNDGVAFSMNAYRAKASKGANTDKSPKATGVKFKGDATVADIVKGLRTMFNKFKENDKTLSLANYLIDALNDYEGDAK